MELGIRLEARLRRAALVAYLWRESYRPRVSNAVLGSTEGAILESVRTLHVPNRGQNLAFRHCATFLAW